MVRTFVVPKEPKDWNLQSLRGTLLDARLRGESAEAAVKRLKSLNPHVDFEKLRAGTVLFVPDAPGFKVSAAASTQAGPIEEFRALVTSALKNAARDVKSGTAARAAERGDVATVLKSAAFKRIADTDKDLAQQQDEAQKAMADEEAKDGEAEKTFATMSKAALAALSQIGKLVG